MMRLNLCKLYRNAHRIISIYCKITLQNNISTAFDYSYTKTCVNNVYIYVCYKYIVHLQIYNLEV